MVRARQIKQGIRIVGIDDSPFEKFGRGKRVLVVGVVQRGDIIEGVLSTRIEKDGEDATRRIIAMLRKSRFMPQIRLILLNGIMLAGFNVVDIGSLHTRLGVPVIALTRRKPDMGKVMSALGKASKTKEEYERKAAIIRRTSPSFEMAAGLKELGIERISIQAAGLGREEAAALLRRFGIGSLRLAHMIGSGIVAGESSGRL